jgi:multiple sugar transport system substrate-binding protein
VHRRRAILGIAVVTAALAACSPAGAAQNGPAPSTSGIGPISFAIGEEDSTSWLPPLITDWNVLHPDQRVTLIYLPAASNDQLAQLVANLAAKSDVYDVIDMDVIWTARFASQGWIIPIQPNQFPLSQFLKPAVQTAEYQGRLYAVPDYSNADLLYYRKDLLAQAGIKQPPATWAQLEQQAQTLAKKDSINGYAGTFAPYEGLTVNFASAVQSEGGSILSPDGTKVTVDSPQALDALQFLVNGFSTGWIPRQALSFEEVSSQDAFEAGQYLFLDNWPDVYSVLSAESPGNKVYGKFGVAALPGPDANHQGSSSLGGANLAISAFSQHQRTALDFIKYMTSADAERQMLVKGGFPPVLTSLYTNKALDSQFPYLPTLEQAIETARPRPAITNYDQASYVISSAVYQALTRQRTPQSALALMDSELTQIIRDG